MYQKFPFYTNPLLFLCTFMPHKMIFNVKTFPFLNNNQREGFTFFIIILSLFKKKIHSESICRATKIIVANRSKTFRSKFTSIKNKR